MIYELSYMTAIGWGYSPPKLPPGKRAQFLPKGVYTVREWGVDGEYLTFDPTMNAVYEFNN